MSSKKITMQIIADKLGITKVSVSKALNNQMGVSDNLKKRIIETSTQLGYYKNKVKMSSINVKKLGFLISKRFFFENENFYTQIYYYLSRDCAKKSISLILYIINSDDERNLVLPFSLIQDNLHGLFISGELQDTYMKLVTNLNIPLVCIDFHKPQLNIDSIVSDNFYSSYNATMYLINNGHKKIGFVGNPNFTVSTMDRYYGYLKALNQNGLECLNEWHIINNDLNGIYITEYLLPSPLPTAFLCHCDMAAYQLMLKLKSQSVSVPDQVSLVSFDNTELSLNSNPTLTTVDIDKHEFATKALQQLLLRANNPSLETQRILLTTKLVQRNSVKRIP